MTETTNPNSLKGLIEEERRTARSRCPRFTHDFVNTTVEERKEREVREAWRSRLIQGFKDVVKQSLENCRSPKSLLAIPYKLANDYFIGTNAVMRVIISDEVNPERIAHLEELITKVWMGCRIYQPTYDDVFRYFNRVKGTVGDLKDCTVGECYWLLELSKLIGCTLSISSREIEKVLAVKDSVNEIDFTRILDRQNEDDKTVLEAMFKQYQELETVFRRL